MAVRPDARARHGGFASAGGGEMMPTVAQLPALRFPSVDVGRRCFARPCAIGPVALVFSEACPHILNGTSNLKIRGKSSQFAVPLQIVGDGFLERVNAVPIALKQSVELSVVRVAEDCIQRVEGTEEGVEGACGGHRRCSLFCQVIKSSFYKRDQPGHSHAKSDFRLRFRPKYLPVLGIRLVYLLGKINDGKEGRQDGQPAAGGRNPFATAMFIRVGRAECFSAEQQWKRSADNQNETYDPAVAILELTHIPSPRALRLIVKQLLIQSNGSSDVGD